MATVNTTEQPPFRSASHSRESTGWELIDRLTKLGLPPETVVAVQVESGDYVTGADLVETMHAYEARFGRGAPGFVRRIGGPFRV